MSGINKETAVRLLSHVPEQNKFWCHDGKSFGTMAELEAGLVAMNEATFKYHVTKDRNDFSKWVYDIICDKDLADALRKSKDKKTATKKVKERLAHLKAI
jgi:hypothetical protein